MGALIFERRPMAIPKCKQTEQNILPGVGARHGEIVRVTILNEMLINIVHGLIQLAAKCGGVGFPT